jgi:myo-inositol-1(or 4)-monophosphatase
MRGIAADLAHALREIVAPRLGAEDGRAHARESIGGDVTFAIDAEAEAFLAGWVSANAPDMAFYSEDRGLVAPGTAEPEWVLVVDPIDGTRPAMAGFESACVSVAAAPLDGEPRMRDVDVGCVIEIKTGQRFVATRDEGVRADVPVRPSFNADLDRLFWTYGLRGRPARETMEVLGPLVDRSSVGGATFELGSAAYDLTRLVTGQLDAYVEPGPRLVAEVPGMRAAFERVGGGAVLNNSPYDLAAGALCVWEGGAVMTDCAGEPLADRPLLGSGAEYQMSVLAAANERLHELLLGEVERGIGRLRARVAGDGPGGRATPDPD